MSTFLKRLLTELETSEQERQFASKRQWVELVIAVADERCSLKPKELLQSLMEIGKTVEEFEAAVALYSSRLQLARETEQLESQLVPRNELHTELQTAVQERNRIVEMHKSKIEEIERRITRNQNLRVTINENRKKLAVTSAPEFIATDRKIEQTINFLKSEEERIRHQISVNETRSYGATNEPVEELKARHEAKVKEIKDQERLREENGRLLFDPALFA